MAKVLATISGTALAPGVSKNNRLYTREAIASAVRRAQGHLADGKILSVLTHHEAGDSSDRIIGRITAMDLDENGAARFTADLADTPHARTIAALADNTTGQPFLTGMSIRGAWVGKVQRLKGPDGPVETASDLEFFGIDPTHKPGVEAAGVDTFAWARDGATETTERVLITESVQEAHVTAITEETAPAGQVSVTGSVTPEPAVLAEALRTVLGTPPAVLESPPLSKRDSGLSGAGRVWADPGYQADKKQRYDLSTKQNAKSAWSYVNQKDNAAKYTPAQLKRVKGRIKAALRKFGVTVAAEGWTIEPAFQVTEAVAEMMGEPEACGSYSLSATNGPTTVTVCSYGLDPADLGVILQAACTAAAAALCAIDPDMDGDIDAPGADAEDPDHDAGDMDNGDGTEDMVRRIMSAIRGESAEDPAALIEQARDTWTQATEVTEASPEDPATVPAAADQETEAPVTETTTTQEAAGSATAAPSFTQSDVSAAVAAALEQDRAARKAAKAAKKAKAAESAQSAAPVTETAGEPDIAALVQEGIKAALAEQGLTETAEQKVARLVAEGVTQAKQELAAQGGGPGRKGLVTEHSPAKPAVDGVPADFPLGADGVMTPMEKWTQANRAAVSDVLQRTYLPYLTRGE